MSLSRNVGSAEYAGKRYPKNPRYDHIKRKLDTGHSVTKYMERLAEIKKNYRYQRNEIFKRIKVKTFAQLILQVSSISGLNESDDESWVTEDSPAAALDADTQGPPEEASQASPSFPSIDAEDTDKSSFASVINDVRGMNFKDDNLENDSFIKPTRSEKPFPDCPYLLLDLRDREDFDSCHIISAQSFPSVMLLRTMNPFTKEILEYKNARGRIIIIYDEDERIAIQAATAMCQRGFENLFMLSGGLKVVAQNFPEGMTTGTIPASCWASPPPSGRRKASLPQPHFQAAENRFWFTDDELAKIQEQLDKLLPYGNGSDRGSTTSSTSSSRTTARTNPRDQRTPWR